MDLVRVLESDHVHAENIARALEWLRGALDRAGIPFALVGGLALRHYGYARFTEDIDILTTPVGLEKIHSELVGRGLTTRFRGARKGLRETEHRVAVDVITAGEHAGSGSSPVVFPDPSSDAFVAEGGLRLPTLPTLVGLKIASGVWGSRDRDLADVEELIKANRLTARFASKLPPELRAKFRELLERARRERRLE
ncbi:MAG: nucleotidyl transferase AbiEii/AbiGii toxin family protein [Planctomycetales bacterium]|nr:nucleotidyl transferase AbiEii/AbiGii toxin family protein [Planctomycetales bacterium]